MPLKNILPKIDALILDFLDRQIDSEVGPVGSVNLSQEPKLYAGALQLIRKAEIQASLEEYPKRSIAEHQATSADTIAAIMVLGRSSGRMYWQLAGKHIAATLERARLIFNLRIQALMNVAGSTLQWALAALTIVTMFSALFTLDLKVLISDFEVIVSAAKPSVLPIFSRNALSAGLDMGVNSSNNRTDWLSNDVDAGLTMRYPEGQAWGAVFITVGQPSAISRPGMDMSPYQLLVLEMRGDPGTAIEVGIKDSTQPDDGTETRISVKLSAEWRTYTIPLTSFAGADLRRIYVVTEWIFTGPQTQTTQVRSIKFSASSAIRPKTVPRFHSVDNPLRRPP
jgi:hypothetical protein